MEDMMDTESVQNEYFNIDLERDSVGSGSGSITITTTTSTTSTTTTTTTFLAGEVSPPPSSRSRSPRRRGITDIIATTTALPTHHSRVASTLEVPSLSLPTTTTTTTTTTTGGSGAHTEFQMKSNKLQHIRKVYQRTPPFPCNWPSLFCMLVEINSLEKELEREQGQRNPHQIQQQTQNPEPVAVLPHPDTPITHRIQRSPAVSNLNEDSLHIISPTRTPDPEPEPEETVLSARARIVKTEKELLMEELELEDKQKKLKKLTRKLTALRQRNSNEHHQKYVTLLEDIIVEKSFEPCAICLDHPEIPSMTPCGHIFCANCIKDAVNHQSIIESKWCPVCRDKIATRDLCEIPMDWKLTKTKLFPWPWNWGKPPQLEIL